MMNFGDIGWGNTILPLGALSALAVLLPAVTVPRATRSQARLAIGIALAAGGTLIAAMLLFAALHLGAGNALRFGAIAGPAVLATIVWGPLLALVWFVRAQGVEKRRGEDLARAGRAEK